MTLRLRVHQRGEVCEHWFDRAQVSVGGSPSSDLVVEGPWRLGMFTWREEVLRFEPWRARAVMHRTAHGVVQPVEAAGVEVRRGDRLSFGDAEVEVLAAESITRASWRPVQWPEGLASSPRDPRIIDAMAATLSALVTSQAPLEVLGQLVARVVAAITPALLRGACLVLPARHGELFDDLIGFDEAGARVEVGVDPLMRFGLEIEAVRLAVREHGLVLLLGARPAVLMDVPNTDRPGALWVIELDDHIPTPEAAGPALEALQLIQDTTRLAVHQHELALELASARQENDHFRDRERRHYMFKELVHESAAMKRAQRQVKRLLAADSPVIILGEAGTGKELIARALHHLALKRDGLFIRVHPERFDRDEALELELFGGGDGLSHGPGVARQGVFELAQRGTVYIEHLEALPLSIQSRLARLLREGEVRRLGESVGRPVVARGVFSTRRPLRELVAQGVLRHDLYMLLKDQRVIVPPLRERAEDLLPLSRVFLQSFARRHNRPTVELHPDLIARLQAHDWPGNVRELQTTIEALLLREADDAVELVGEAFR